MKRPIALPFLAVFLVWAVAGCSQTKPETTSSQATVTERVSAETIAQLPTGKTLEIDLTRKGTVYSFDDANTDFNRVTIRTDEGVRNFGELLKKSNTSVRKGVVLGRPGDMHGHLPASSGGSSAYDCGVVTCQCEGDADCISLIMSGKCGDKYWCSKDTNYCYCDAKL